MEMSICTRQMQRSAGVVVALVHIRILVEKSEDFVYVAHCGRRTDCDCSLDLCLVTFTREVLFQLVFLEKVEVAEYLVKFHQVLESLHRSQMVVHFGRESHN